MKFPVAEGGFYCWRRSFGVNLKVPASLVPFAIRNQIVVNKKNAERKIKRSNLRNTS